MANVYFVTPNSLPSRKALIYVKGLPYVSGFILFYFTIFQSDTYLNLKFVPYFILSEVMQVDISSGTKFKHFAFLVIGLTRKVG